MDDLETDFTLFPNPTSGIADVNFTLSKTEKVRLEVKDILGKTVTVVFDEVFGSGFHKSKLPALSSGIYLIDLTVNNKHVVRKLVVS